MTEHPIDGFGDFADAIADADDLPTVDHAFAALMQTEAWKQNVPARDVARRVAYARRAGGGAVTFKGSRSGPAGTYVWRQLRIWWVSRLLGNAVNAMPGDADEDFAVLHGLAKTIDALGRVP